MQFGYLFANAGPFADPELFAHLATTAEDVGIESLWTVEHVVVPVGYESTYPYDPSGRMPGPENSPIFDPILPLTYAAAITSKIKLATGVVILPQRHPFYIAKEAATLDVLSGGRAILGIGVGWLEEEFDALGIPFQTRASRTRETVEAMRQLWSPGAKSFEGKHFQWGEVESNPKPVQEGGVPIVVGGHTEIAAKRAARYGDGFFPAMVSEEQLASLTGIMRAECEKVGRDPSEIELTTTFMLPDLDLIRRLEDQGVERLITAPPGFDRDGLSRGLEQFANEVIAKL